VTRQAEPVRAARRSVSTGALDHAGVCIETRAHAVLHRIQQLTIDRVMFAPIMDYRTLRGVGPLMAEHMLDTQHLVPYPAWEEMRMK
jgi:hypothetical protein